MRSPRRNPLLQARLQDIHLRVRKGFFRTPGLPARVEAKLPTACVVAAVVGVANHFGYGPYPVFPLSHHNEPFMPGDRTCSGGAYTFQIPGPLTVAENVAIPMKVQDAASIRCIYAYLQQGTADGQSAYLVKIARWRDDVGAARVHGHRAARDAVQEHLRLPGDEGLRHARHAPPAVCRLRADTTRPITGSGVAQTVATASYDASTAGWWPGLRLPRVRPGERGARERHHRGPGQPDVRRHRDHEASGGASDPTYDLADPVLLEGDDLAFDILAVASPDPGSDLTVVIRREP